MVQVLFVSWAIVLMAAFQTPIQTVKVLIIAFSYFLRYACQNYFRAAGWALSHQVGDEPNYTSLQWFLVIATEFEKATVSEVKIGQ